MLTKILPLLIVFLHLTACANPQYAAPNKNVPGNLGQKTETCLAKFSSGTCVSLTWEKMPTEDDSGSFVLKTFLNNQNIPIAVDLEGKLAVVLWMPSMGHGSSPTKVERTNTGTYHVTNVFFSMKGDWEIRIQLKDGNEIKDQAIIPISI